MRESDERFKGKQQMLKTKINVMNNASPGRKKPKQGLSANTTKNNLINNRDKIHICIWRGRSLSECFFQDLNSLKPPRQGEGRTVSSLWMVYEESILFGIVHCLHFLSEPCKGGSSFCFVFTYNLQDCTPRCHYGLVDDYC